MTAANGNLDMIYAGRLVAGLGIGASSLTVPVYISETAPPSIRGRLVGIFEIASQGGGMLGFWINYGTDQHISSNSVAQYVIPLALQLAPGLLLGLGMFFFCPESPRWLARQDNFEAAEKVLCNLRGLPSDHEYIMRELGDIRRQVEERSTLNRTKKEQFMKLFQRGTRNRMGIGLALMFLQSFTGVNIITYYGMSNLVPIFFFALANTLQLPESSRPSASQEHRPSSSPRASTESPRHSACAHSPSTLSKRSAAEEVSSGALLSVAFRKSCRAYNNIPNPTVTDSEPSMLYIGGYVMKNDPVAAAAAGNSARSAAGYVAMVAVYINAFIICATWQGIRSVRLIIAIDFEC
jgi:hypothetical protein